jgi:hypothetical protein
MLRVLLALSALWVGAACFMDFGGSSETLLAAMLPAGFVLGIAWLVS